MKPNIMKAFIGLLHQSKWRFWTLVALALGAIIIAYGPSAVRTTYNPRSNGEMEKHIFQSTGNMSSVDEDHVLGEIIDSISKEKPRQQKDTEPETQYLLNLLKEKINRLRKLGYLQTIPKTSVCTKDVPPWDVCKDPNCKSPPSQPMSVLNIENVRKPVRMVGGTKKLWEKTKYFNVNPKKKKKKYVFLTGASSNHFKESEAAIQSLYSNVFPHLTNYSLVYYDLGLTAKERAIVKNVSGIEFKDFPFAKFSPTFKFLRGFTWKPLIVLSHLDSAEFVLWLDSSVNFAGDARPYFDNASHTGIILNRNRFAFPQHTYTKMFKYFTEEACNFAEYGELEGGFLVFHNEPFIRHLVLEPWVACALDENCMCPQESKSMLDCNLNIRKYGKCHRYDQSAISLILGKLFKENVESVIVKNKIHSVLRGQTGTFLTNGGIVKKNI